MQIVTLVGRTRYVPWKPILVTLSMLIFSTAIVAAQQFHLPRPGGDFRQPAFNNPPRVAAQPFQAQPPVSINRVTAFPGLQVSPRQNFQNFVPRPTSPLVALGNPFANQTRPYVFNNSTPFRPNPAMSQTLPYNFNNPVLHRPTLASPPRYQPVAAVPLILPFRKTPTHGPVEWPSAIGGFGSGSPNWANRADSPKTVPVHRVSPSIVIGKTSSFAPRPHSEPSPPTRTGSAHPLANSGKLRPLPPTRIGPKLDSVIDQQLALARRDSLAKAKGTPSRPGGSSLATSHDPKVHSVATPIGLFEDHRPPTGSTRIAASNGFKAPASQASGPATGKGKIVDRPSNLPKRPGTSSGHSVVLASKHTDRLNETAILKRKYPPRTSPSIEHQLAVAKQQSWSPTTSKKTNSGLTGGTPATRPTSQVLVHPIRTSSGAGGLMTTRPTAIPNGQGTTLLASNKGKLVKPASLGGGLGLIDWGAPVTVIKTTVAPAVKPLEGGKPEKVIGQVATSAAKTLGKRNSGGSAVGFTGPTGTVGKQLGKVTQPIKSGTASVGKAVAKGKLGPVTLPIGQGLKTPPVLTDPSPIITNKGIDTTGNDIGNGVGKVAVFAGDVVLAFGKAFASGGSGGGTYAGGGRETDDPDNGGGYIDANGNLENGPPPPDSGDPPTSGDPGNGQAASGPPATLPDDPPPATNSDGPVVLPDVMGPPSNLKNPTGDDIISAAVAEGNYLNSNKIIYSENKGQLDSGTGEDCSHYVNDVLDDAGFNSPYVTTAQIAKSGAYRVVASGQQQPGDIIVQGGHMGIYTGTDQNGNPQGWQMGNTSDDPDDDPNSYDKNGVRLATWGNRPGTWFPQYPSAPVYYRPNTSGN